MRDVLLNPSDGGAACLCRAHLPTAAKPWPEDAFGFETYEGRGVHKLFAS